MGCDRFETLWFRVIEGTAAPSEREEAEMHRAACARCARLADGLERLEHALEALGEERPEPPPYLAARVKARLRELPRPGRWRRWWGRFPALRPATTLAALVLAFFVGLLAREVHRLNAVLGERGQVVVIEFADPDAREVRLVGDFNDWGRTPGPVDAVRQGDRWVFRLRLEPGRYQYSFVVDGTKWLPDPNAPGIIPDGFGGRNSVLYVGAERAGIRL